MLHDKGHKRGGNKDIICKHTHNTIRRNSSADHSPCLCNCLSHHLLWCPFAPSKYLNAMILTWDLRVPCWRVWTMSCPPGRDCCCFPLTLSMGHGDTETHHRASWIQTPSSSPSMDGWMDRWVDGWMIDGCKNEWMDDEWMDGEMMDRWMGGWMIDGWMMDGWMDRWMIGAWVDGWVSEWMIDEQMIDGWMGGWMDDRWTDDWWMDGRVDGWIDDRWAHEWLEDGWMID